MSEKDAQVKITNSDIQGITEVPLTLEEAKETLIRYGVRVIFPVEIGPFNILPVKISIIFPKLIFFPRITKNDKDNSIIGVASELTYYPEDFFIRNNSSTFYVANLGYPGGKCSPLTGDIILSSQNFGVVESPIARLAFHHELLHKLEFKTKQGVEFEKIWNREFPRASTMRIILSKLLGKEIEGKYERTYDDFRSIPDSAWIGINTSNYGVVSQIEDRASTATVLFLSPEYWRNTLFNNRSETIKRKLSYVISLLYALSGGKMGASYWVDYAEGKVDSNYWRTRS